MYCVRSGNKTTITHQYHTQVIFEATNVLCEVWEQDDYNTSVSHRLYLKQPTYCVRSGNKTTITHQYHAQVIFEATNVLCEVWEQDDYNTSVSHAGYV